MLTVISWAAQLGAVDSKGKSIVPSALLNNNYCPLLDL